MTFSQPDPDVYVKNGYSFFRLKQELASAGDIFESPQSCNAIGLGPDSDISKVSVAYHDDQALPTFQSILTLSPQRPFGALLNAFNGTKKYSPSNVPARILIWPEEIFDADYVPTGFTPNTDQLVFEKPLIDIIQYFEKPDVTSAIRADKTYLYDTLPFGTNDCFVLLPYYGRRYASFVMHNSSGDQNCQVTISGVNFRIHESPEAMEIPLYTAFTLGFSETISRVITPDYDSRIGETPPLTNNNRGLFDYLLLQFNPGGGGASPVNISLRVVVSDVSPA